MEETQETTTVSSETPQQSPVSPQPTGSGRRWFIVVLIVVLLIVGVVSFLLFSQQQATKEVTTTVTPTEVPRSLEEQEVESVVVSNVEADLADLEKDLQQL